MGKRTQKAFRASDGSGQTRLNFYSVDQRYVDELKSVDPKIPNIQYETHDKFICGIMFDIGGLKYFAPVSSFKRQQKTNFLIKNSHGKPVGCIRFSFMFPIVDSKRKIKNFLEEDEARRYLLLEELAYCNTQVRRIHSKAQHVYDVVVSGADPHMAAVCCDFKKLEAYVRTHYGEWRNVPKVV